LNDEISEVDRQHALFPERLVEPGLELVLELQLAVRTHQFARALGAQQAGDLVVDDRHLAAQLLDQVVLALLVVVALGQFALQRRVGQLERDRGLEVAQDPGVGQVYDPLAGREDDPGRRGLARLGRRGGFRRAERQAAEGSGGPELERQDERMVMDRRRSWAGVDSRPERGRGLTSPAAEDWGGHTRWGTP
jgi:hypothetical protein